MRSKKKFSKEKCDEIVCLNQEDAAQYVYSPESLAKVLGVKKATILRWTKMNKIPCVQFSPKVYRYNLARVLDAIKYQNKKDESR